MKFLLFIVIILVVLTYIKTTVVSNFVNSILGKFLFLMILVYTALNCKTACFLLAILFISLLDINNVNEYFNSKSSLKKYKSDINSKKKFVEEHCKKIMKNGKRKWKFINYVDDKIKSVGINDIADTKILSQDKSISYKVNFKNKVCNPCDTTCKYSITESVEQLTTEERLRPRNSSKIIK